MKQYTRFYINPLTGEIDHVVISDRPLPEAPEITAYRHNEQSDKSPTMVPIDYRLEHYSFESIDGKFVRANELRQHVTFDKIKSTIVASPALSRITQLRPDPDAVRKRLPS